MFCSRDPEKSISFHPCIIPAGYMAAAEQKGMKTCLTFPEGINKRP